MKKGSWVAALAFAVAMTAPLAAVAETFNIQMTGQNRSFLRGDRFVIPTYHLNFVTSQQATSVVSIGARTRLAMVRQGVDRRRCGGWRTRPMPTCVARWKKRA